MTVEADWADVVGSLAPGLLRLALMLTGSMPDAEDLLQVTFERAHRHGDRIAAMTSPGGYLRTVMVNAHLKLGRRKRFRMVPIETVHDLAGPAPAADGDDMWQLLAALPRQQRAVLVLRYYEDLPDDEIAALVGCSRATVRSHASHGLATLRAGLDSQETP